VLGWVQRAGRGTFLSTDWCLTADRLVPGGPDAELVPATASGGPQGWYGAGRSPVGLCLVRRFPTQVGFRDGEEITEAEALTAVGVLQSA